MRRILRNLACATTIAMATAVLAQGTTPAITVAPMPLSSPSIQEGAHIPDTFACVSGPAVKSPALNWGTPPKDTKSIVVYFHDLDPHPGGGIDDNIHWAVWNLPATATGVPEDVKSGTAEVAGGGVQGLNGHNTAGYFGPCPPPGATDHHYVFEVYALNTTVDVAPTANRHELFNQMDHHIVGHGVLSALYKRAK